MIDVNNDLYTKGMSEGRDIRVTIECLGSTLDDVLQHVDQAIKACGFYPKGEIAYLDEDES